MDWFDKRKILLLHTDTRNRPSFEFLWNVNYRQNQEKSYCQNLVHFCFIVILNNALIYKITITMAQKFLIPFLIVCFYGQTKILMIFLLKRYLQFRTHAVATVQDKTIIKISYSFQSLLFLFYCKQNDNAKFAKFYDNKRFEIEF